MAKQPSTSYLSPHVCSDRDVKYRRPCLSLYSSFELLVEHKQTQTRKRLSYATEHAIELIMSVFTSTRTQSHALGEAS